jgi:small subunit ribosomal protein S20
MNKKQRNRKTVAQNKRNRVMNRRYTSTIKTLSKIFLRKINIFETEKNLENQTQLKKETKNLINNLYSVIDKAVKKNVIHKNRAARKKSKLGHLFFQQTS